MSTLASPITREIFLDNGLKVVFVPAGAAAVATLMIVYRIGARNEAVGYTGSSHLLEHMLFKGTPANSRRNGRAFADMMNEIGASKNATTWIDRTNYFETVPLGYLDFAIELEADRMRNATIADSDRRSEMTVVRNELERNDNNHGRVLDAALVGTAFREHPYHHPTIGWRSDVEGVSTERLRELYDTYYHPNNATAFVVGDVDVERTLATIERRFGSLRPAPRSIPEIYTEEPPQAGERSVVVKRPGETTLVALAFHTPAALGQRGVLSARDLAQRADSHAARNDSYALEVLARILGRGRTSRLSRALVDTALALDVSAWNWASRDPGLFQIVVRVRPGASVPGVRRELDGAIASLASDGPQEFEIERAQTQIEVQRAFACDGTYSLAQRLGEFEAVGGWRLDEDFVERVRRVGVDDVREAARAYLHEDNRTLGILIPGTAKTFDVVPFEPVEERASPDPAPEAAILPQPGAERTASFAERIAEGTGASGIRWRYVASPGSPTVHVRGIIDAGPAFAPEHPMLPAIVAEMLSRGTRRHERHAIEDRLERAGIRRSYYVDDDRSQSYNALAFRFSAACVAEDVSLLLETLAEEVREPAFAPEELALVKAEMTGSLQLARTSTSGRAMQRFLQLAYEAGDPNDEQDIDASLADVAAIDADDVRAYHERVVLGGSAIVSAAGGIGDANFAREFERSFGTIGRSAYVAATARVRARPSRELRESIALERKANVDIVIGRATSLVRADPGYLAALVANGILGQSTLSSRLGVRLRDREGLTYGVTSGFLSAGRVCGPWRVAVSVNPANVERAVASVRDVLAAYSRYGPTERELTQQIHSLAGQHQVALATNAGIAAQLERMSYYGLPRDYVDTYREAVAAVSASQVRSAIGRYLSERDLIVVAAGTFS
ncbi:MAG: insulinase family protein [Candidatus Eremiobacteraeota bacterium]|nr:insulinase family protein [Candidatus Eremiobacteraeota bacterium]